jgi:hypothetical protein
MTSRIPGCKLMAEEVPPVFVAVIQDITARKVPKRHCANAKASARRHGALSGLDLRQGPARAFHLVNREFCSGATGSRPPRRSARPRTIWLPARQADDAVRRERLALADGRVFFRRDRTG